MRQPPNAARLEPHAQAGARDVAAAHAAGDDGQPAAATDADAHRRADRQPQRHRAPPWTSRTCRDGPMRVNVVSRPSRRVRTPVIGRQRPPAMRSSIRTGVRGERTAGQVGQAAADAHARRPRDRRAPQSPAAALEPGRQAAARLRRAEDRARRRARRHGTRPLCAEATRTVPPPSVAATTARRRCPASRAAGAVGPRAGAADLDAAAVAAALPAVVVGDALAGEAARLRGQRLGRIAGQRDRCPRAAAGCRP